MTGVKFEFGSFEGFSVFLLFEDVLLVTGEVFAFEGVAEVLVEDKL